MDEGDAVLRKALAWSIINVLRAQYRRRNVGDAGKRRGIRIWTLSEPPFSIPVVPKIADSPTPRGIPYLVEKF
jgi:hypothetical protein